MLSLIHKILRAFGSPLLTPVFLVLPVVIIGLHVTHIAYLGPKLILPNNLLLLLHLLVRLGGYLVAAPRPIRYGPGKGIKGRRGVKETTALGVEEVRARLAAGGYALKESAGYGEKRESGYMGSIAVHMGLILLIAVGTADYFRQFDVNILLGTGNPANLYEDAYSDLYDRGPFGTDEKLDFGLKVTSQVFKGDGNPRDETGFTLIGRGGEVLLEDIVSPGSPVDFGRYEISTKG